ncbi:hypothetical protein MC885_012285 [Smutsia gigantea]|nr:hypothetical protein MC885_012285 [Smutsia gigantea]
MEHFAQTSPATETPKMPNGGPISTTWGCLGTYVPKVMLSLVDSVPSACQGPLPTLAQPRSSHPSTSGKFPNPRDLQVFKGAGSSRSSQPTPPPSSQEQAMPQGKVSTVAYSRLFTPHPNSERRKERGPYGEAATYLGFAVFANKDAHSAGGQLEMMTFIPSPRALSGSHLGVSSVASFSSS